ncbi:MAG: peptidylprolyl isomerase [Nanoarchaeota archaeon]|nr:peptidylprolyl isomerase [Nanoarchaeota archaeon]MBU1028171.1 peptidylprolyl isomerase [Nanoarchaeota archaeon]
MEKIPIIISIIGVILIIVLGLQNFNLTGNTTMENTENINKQKNTKDNMENTIVLFETNMGDIEIKLYNDMPITTGNFKKLVEDGVYDGVIFHRVISGFMIQGGDPTGTGFGDPKIPNIKDEFTHKPGNFNNRGTISMANAGPNTGSSQFFINLVNNNFLDTKHPAFGEVIEGIDVVDKIAEVKKDSQDRPIEEVQIIKASIIE